MDARSVVSLEDDERSICTAATTASLASRIQSLAVDFGPKHRRKAFDHFTEDVEEEDEDVISMTEEELLEVLERQEPAFQVCSKLFKQPFSRSLSLKHLDLEKAEAFRATGYTVVDNFISREYAVRLRAETLTWNRQGMMRFASQLFRDRAADETARGDKIAWLHPSALPSNSPFQPLFAAVKDLKEDLSKLMHLTGSKTEIQLGYYPPNGAQYVRHRDAFPDDGSESDQRRVTAILYLNPGWRREDGGKLRLWLPHADAQVESTSQEEHAAQPDLRHQSSGLSSTPSSQAEAVQGLRESTDPAGPSSTDYLHPRIPNAHRFSSQASSPHAAERDVRRLESLGSDDSGGVANGSIPDGQPALAEPHDPSVIMNGHCNGNSHALENGHSKDHALENGHSSSFEHDSSESHHGNGISGNGPAGPLQELQGLEMTNDVVEAQNQLAFDPNHPLSSRLHSPGSLNGSLIVEPTEASSAHDNVSVDEPSREISQLRAKGAEDVEVGTAAAVDVAPKAGCLVIFLSGAIEHAVLPNFSDRLAITFWMQ